MADLRYCKTGEKHAHPIYYRFIKSKVTKIRLLSASRGARNPNVKVVITHAWHLYSQDGIFPFFQKRSVDQNYLLGKASLIAKVQIEKGKILTPLDSQRF